MLLAMVKMYYLPAYELITVLPATVAIFISITWCCWPCMRLHSWQFGCYSFSGSRLCIWNNQNLIKIEWLYELSYMCYINTIPYVMFRIPIGIWMTPYQYDDCTWRYADSQMLYQHHAIFKILYFILWYIPTIIIARAHVVCPLCQPNQACRWLQKWLVVSKMW